MTIHIHPSVDGGVKKGSGKFAGGTLVCTLACCAPESIARLLIATAVCRGANGQGLLS